MYYIIDVDIQEIVSQVDTWDDAVREMSSLQRRDAECEIYRDFEIVRDDEWSDWKAGIQLIKMI